MSSLKYMSRSHWFSEAPRNERWCPAFRWDLGLFCSCPRDEGGTKVHQMATSSRRGALLQIENGSKLGQTLLAIKIQVQMQDRRGLSSVSQTPYLDCKCISEACHSCWLDFCHFWELHPDKEHDTRQGVTTARRELSLLRPTEFLFLGSLQFLSERRERES